MAEKAQWTKVGTIFKKHNGKGNFLKVDADITLKAGQFVNVQNPRKRVGITDEQLAKIPESVVAELYLAPAKAE